MKIEEKNNISIPMPIRAGTVIDTMSKSLSMSWKLFVRYMPLIILFILIASAFHIGWQILSGNQAERLDPALENLFNDFIRTYFLKNQHYQFVILLAYIPVLYAVFRLIKDSEPFQGIKPRNFVLYIVWYILNYIVVMFGVFLALLVASIPFIIIAVIVSMTMATGNPVVIVFAFILMALLVIAFILIMIFISSLAMCGLPLSIFSKVYPIATYKYMFMVPFSRCGERSGGLKGRNLWHLVGLVSITILVYLVIASVSSLGITFMDILVPRTFSFSHYLVDIGSIALQALTMSFYVLVMYTAPMIYLSEAMHLSSYPLKDEIIKREQQQ